MNALVVSRNTEPRVSYKMNEDLAAALLVDAVGHIRAHRRALREQQNARRARSRKRFAFWMRVESEITDLEPACDENGKRPDGRGNESGIVGTALSVRTGSARNKFAKDGHSPASLQRPENGNAPWLGRLPGVPRSRPGTSSEKCGGLAWRGP
jgi:hypothetical protein